MRDFIHKAFGHESFLKNILLLVSGTLLAQVISFLASPVLTRLYSPASYGEFGLFTACAAIAGALICFRYELALVIPRSKEHAAALFCLAVICCCINTVCITLLVTAAGKYAGFALVSGHAFIRYMVFPIYIFCSGIFSICNYWYTREGKFKYLAKRQVAYTILTVLAELCFAWLLTGDSGLGLVLGSTLALGGTTLVLFISIIKQDWDAIKQVRWRDIRKEAWRYREFPLFSSWTAVFNTLSFSLPSLMLSAYFNSETVGCYNLGYKILDLPISLIGTSVAQAFYPNIREQDTPDKKKQAALTVLRHLFETGFVPLALISIAAPWIFSIIFGEEWLVTGYYVRLLAPWLFLVFIASPVSDLYIVLNRQKEHLIMNIAMLAVRFLSLYIGGRLRHDRVAIGLFGAAGAVMWILNMTYILSKVGVHMGELFQIVKAGVKTGAKYLILPVLSLFFHNRSVFFISFLCGLWFLYGYYVKIRRGADGTV